MMDQNWDRCKVRSARRTHFRKVSDVILNFVAIDVIVTH
jgi:hypothetical protein